MSVFDVIVITMIALLLGAVLGHLIAQLRAARHNSDLRVQLEAARTRVAADAERQAEQLELLARSEANLRAAFDQLAGESLRNNSETFLQIARETLSREQHDAHGALKERETAIAQLLLPIREALGKTEQQVSQLDRERRETFTQLRTQIESLAGGQAQLSRETRNLSTALRRPEVRGRWGEVTLRRVVELAGMSSHCDFTEQGHVATDNGALRPDMIVHMPEEREIVVDAKTPLDAYLEATEAPDDERRGMALKRHAQQVETQVRQLASKSYWSQFEHSPEFTVLFLPGDQFLSAALAERPDMIDDALRQSVIIATPSTLIALLKVVAYGWRQSAVTKNAEEIRDLGQELYKRLLVFVSHLDKLGQRLGASVESYNNAVGSLERQVLPQARRFPELGATTAETIAPLQTIEALARTSALPSTATKGPAEAS